MTESAIQSAITRLLHSAGVGFLDTSKAGAVVNRLMKLLAGFPDLLVFLGDTGRVICLEVKRPKDGRVGTKQKAFARYLKRFGVPVYIVTSAESAWRVVKACADGRRWEVTDYLLLEERWKGVA